MNSNMHLAQAMTIREGLYKIQTRQHYRRMRTDRCNGFHFLPDDTVAPGYTPSKKRHGTSDLAGTWDQRYPTPPPPDRQTPVKT